VFFSIILTADVVAAANDVIAPGQEQLLAEMLGRGEALPGSCTFSNGQVESALVRGTYQCAGGEVVVELRHPSWEQGAVATTERFAISVPSGSPPAGLVEALASRIRQREARFLWKSPASPGEGGGTRAFAFIEIDTGMIQAVWAILILMSPLLCWRCAQAVGIAGTRVLMTTAVAILLAAASTWRFPDEPLHANGHAWREAREVLMPWGERSTGGEPFIHGQGGIALQWLLAAGEMRLTGEANPFHISRYAGAAAAGAVALLAAVLVGAWPAGLAAGCVFALMPLAHMVMLSGSALMIPAWILPWSLALLIAAGKSGDRLLLAGAILAAGLGTLSHTAMLAWPPALLVAWLLVARRRVSLFAVGAFLLLGAAMFVQLTNVFDMIASRNEGPSGGLMGEALRGLRNYNLFIDSHWVSPLLPPMFVIWLLNAFRRGRLAITLASVVPLVIVAAPFFAVIQCSSDAVRYQGALLPWITSLAVAGLWSLPVPARLARGVNVVRVALLATLVLMPPASRRPPTDPVAAEHHLVADAVGRMQPGTLVVLPKGRFETDKVIPDFPDFMLPENSRVVFEGDPRIDTHVGQRLAYLGLACVSGFDTNGKELSELRPECRRLRDQARPWAVRTLTVDDLPRSPDGEIWTFHQLAVGVPFGFFELEAPRAKRQGVVDSGSWLVAGRTRTKQSPGTNRQPPFHHNSSISSSVQS
jgi:hypothetical protein